MFIPKREKNLFYRSREYLTLAEVHRLIEAAGKFGRYPLRDRTLLLMMFRHGLRAGEASSLKWDAIRFDHQTMRIIRLRKGLSGIHQLQEDELEALVELRKYDPDEVHVFINERGGPLTTGAIAKIVERAGEVAELPISVHPHMLRHSCGFYLAEQGFVAKDIQKYLGHRNVQNAAMYTSKNRGKFNRRQQQS